MISSDNKCVMIINADLPTGVIANTSAILGVSLGKQVPELVGENTLDADRNEHIGIITIPIALLKGDCNMMKILRKRLYNTEFSDLVVVDFSEIAQKCNVYEEYEAKVAELSEEFFTYLGIGIYGDKKKINKLTGSMPLLR